MGETAARGNLVLDLSKVERSTALNAWLVYHNLPKKKLAQRLGISPSTMTRTISGQRRSSLVNQALEQLGVPAELLP